MNTSLQMNFFDKKISNHDIENELLNIDNYVFSFQFSNYGSPKNFIMRIKKNGYPFAEIKFGKQVIVERENRGSCDFTDLEKDFPKTLYDELNFIKNEMSL